MQVEHLHGLQPGAVMAEEARGGGIGVENGAGVDVDGQHGLDAAIERGAEGSAMGGRSEPCARNRHSAHPRFTKYRN